MKRFIKWFLVVVLVGWMLFSTTVTFFGWQYVYAFEVVPLFYEEETLLTVSTSAEEVLLPRPPEPKEATRINVHGSPVPGLCFLKECMYVRNPDFILHLGERTGELELYVVSHERDGKTIVHKAIFVGVQHPFGSQKTVARN